MENPPPIIGAQMTPTQSPAPATGEASRPLAMWALSLILLCLLSQLFVLMFGLWVDFKMEQMSNSDLEELFEKKKLARNIVTPLTILLWTAGAFLVVYADRQRITGWAFRSLVALILLNAFLEITWYLGFQIFYVELREKLENLHGIIFLALMITDTLVGIGIYWLLALGRTKGIQIIWAGSILAFGFYRLFMLMLISTSPYGPLPPDWAEKMATILGILEPLFSWWRDHDKTATIVGFMLVLVGPLVGLLALIGPMALGRPTRPDGSMDFIPIQPEIPSAGSKLYYVHHQGVLKGPFEVGQLQDEIQAGRVLQDDMASSEGDAQWRPVKDVLPG